MLMDDSIWQVQAVKAADLIRQKEYITVVSGLPRSGTSMMMQMLEAGGMPILTDGLRTQDESNLKGYYEYEPVKALAQGDYDWLGEAQGKAVKIVSPLIEYLPAGHDYKVIFMIRKLSEVLASQRAMLVQRGEVDDQAPDEVMAEVYQNHLAQVTGWLHRQPRFEVLFVPYNEMFVDPIKHIAEVAKFLTRALDQNRMIGVIDKNLYRRRQ